MMKLRTIFIIILLLTEITVYAQRNCSGYPWHLIHETKNYGNVSSDDGPSVFIMWGGHAAGANVVRKRGVSVCMCVSVCISVLI